jgi:hypothetical protein
MLIYMIKLILVTKSNKEKKEKIIKKNHLKWFRQKDFRAF